MRILSAPGGELTAAEWAEVRGVLRGDELLIYPTDTLYALGGLALRPSVSRRVRRAKLRDSAKALPVVAADREQARSLCALWPEAAERLATVFWPGPLTLVLPAAVGVPEEVTAAAGTIGVRVPASALTRHLCVLAGPLVATSANRSGDAAPATCAAALAAVGEEAALAIDAGQGGSVASTVVDLTAVPPRLVRAGAIAWEAALRALETGHL